MAPRHVQTPFTEMRVAHTVGPRGAVWASAPYFELFGGFSGSFVNLFFTKNIAYTAEWMVLATGFHACTCFISEAADTRFLKTVVFIAGKKNPATKNILFVLPLEIWLQTSIFMHQVGLNGILDAISPLKWFLKLYFNGKTNKMVAGFFLHAINATVFSIKFECSLYYG